MSLNPSLDTIASLLEGGVEILSCSAPLAPLEIRPRYECEILLSHILGVERIYLHTHSPEAVTSESSQRFLELLALRAEGRPLEYLTGRVSFYGREFGICEGVLVPRPETELLVERASELITRFGLTHIAEVGVGSGIVSISLALLHQGVHFIATDINPTAINLTRQNIALHAPSAQIELFHCSMLECLNAPSALSSVSQSLAPQAPASQPPTSQSFMRPLATPQLIVSNPPYIARDYPISTPLTYEPREALFSGDDGLCALRELITLAQGLKAWLVCEIGYDQREGLTQILNSHGAHEVAFYKDYSGFDRGFIARF